MSVDIVIVTHESAEHIERAIGNLRSVGTVVVVDNASTDDTVQRVRAAGVRVIENEVNAGFAAGANQGAGLGSAELILFLNPDAALVARDLRRLVEELDGRPDLAVVAPRVVYCDGTEQRVSWPFPSSRRAWAEAVGVHRVIRRREPTGFVIGTCFLIRRAVFETLGGFDTRYWLYGEETDLCCRAAEEGWGVALVPDAQATHVGAASTVNASELAAEHFERGGERYILDHEGKFGLVSYRLATIASGAIRSVALRTEDDRALHRRRMQRSARELVTHPLSVRLESPATRNAGSSIVVCSLEPWDEIWRRNQFLVRELVDIDPHLRILFVEPPFDLGHELRASTGTVRRRGLRPVRGDGRVLAFQPRKVLPRILGQFADRSLRRQVQRAVYEAGFVRPTLWINDVNYADLLNDLGWPSLYDITDDWLLASRADRTIRRLRRRERDVLRHVDEVVVCSPSLARSRRETRPDLRVIPNAVDREHFATPQPRPADLPPAPVAVYVGTLHEDRLDVDLLDELARTQPALAIALVGPDALSPASHSVTSARDSIHILGPRPYADVPAYLQHADVVIVPHVVTPFTESLDPIKAHECLAVGRPTVATRVAGFRDVGPPIRAVAREEFTSTVVDAIAEANGAAPRRVSTWAERGREFRAALDAAIAKNEHTPLKVVFLDHCAQLSGGELALSRLITGLSPAINSHVILAERGPLEAMIRRSGATVEVMPLPTAIGTTHREEVRFTITAARRAIGTVGYINRLATRLRYLQPDVVHTNSLKAAVYGGLAARIARVPVVWHIRDRISSDYLPRSAEWAIKAMALVVPNAVVFNSQATREACRMPVRFAKIPSTVIYDSISGFRAPDRPSSVRTHFVMVGRLAPWKGQDLFLRAFARAFPGGTEHATIAGAAMFDEDEYAATLPPLAQALRIEDRVRFAGFVNDIPALLADCDAVVHASTIPEPFGQVVIEGMAAGLPVIASGAGGPLEVITDRVDGLLFEPNSVDDLAAALRLVATDRQLRLKLGSRARARALDFAPEIIGAAIESVWRGMLQGRRSLLGRRRVV